ncbi:MAG: sulfite exporter TauE/SafE family protein [Methylococcales bacterium]|nr:sulfite exporter TauE/SafE family protein [Methylococcales bacterium]
MTTLLLALALAVLIGLLLGLMGGGGSILTVPMLVYVLGIEPKTAIVTAFVVVGLSSLGALLPHAREQAVCWRSGLWFGISGMAGAYGGGVLAHQLSATILLTIFGLLSLGTGWWMLRRPAQAGKPANQCTDRLCPKQVPYGKVLGYGALIGLVTGLVGVGGGFLIVPALNLLVGLTLPAAVGTSLMIIAMNCLAGFAGYQQHAAFDAELTLMIAAGALLGSGIGARLSTHIDPEWLRVGFAWLVIAVALFMLGKNLPIMSSLVIVHA